jgi:hypothetical protein
MKVLFVNPHRSDFVYNSPAYSFIKRKSLKKYEYLKLFFNQSEADFIFITSSLIRFLKFFKLDIFFLIIEIKIFKKINRFSQPIFLIRNSNYYDLTFCFGFSIRDLSKEQFEGLVNKSKYIIIHLSHYHIYANKLNDWSKFNNVIFCADTDIRDTYFYNYFLGKNNSFFILSYSIDSNKFKCFNSFGLRESKIICTGTFHEFEKIYSNFYLKKNVVSGVFGFLSLHPERRMLYYFKNKLHNLVIFNSPMGAFNIFKMFRKNNSLNQYNYFSLNIVEEYNKYKFSFIGEESISGLPGIGVFESILCGCVPIVNDFSYKGTPLENSIIPIRYSNMNNLYNKIINLDEQNSRFCFTDEDLQNLRYEVANFFSELNQLESLNKFLNKLT